MINPGIPKGCSGTGIAQPATNPLLETAACDGPVKFHRIVNKFFSVDFNKSEEESDGPNNPRNNEMDIKYDFKNIDISLKGSIENKFDMSIKDDDDESADTGDTYSCVYCNHVFKSHYCYQKHKR